MLYNAGTVRGRLNLDGVTIEVELVREITDEVVEAFGRLLPQLSTSAARLDRQGLAAIATWQGNSLLLARIDGVIVGALTLVVFPIPSGLRARIEDVVVDTAARGRGVGARLTERALEIAHELGARTVDLTSRPARETANRLYERMGFARRDSTVYRKVP
jgi:ribosomal protein S18 acetylase RimI-like enzyme